MNKVWFCWCFSTNRAHALDLCLVFVTRTHFEQGVGRSVDFPISKSECFEPITMMYAEQDAVTQNLSLFGRHSEVVRPPKYDHLRQILVNT